MTLNMKNYKGFQKKPYCSAHYPSLTATTVAETPESKRLANQSKNQSQIQYHADFEKSKSEFTTVVDTPETSRLLSQSKNQSQVQYHAEYEKTKGAESIVGKDSAPAPSTYSAPAPTPVSAPAPTPSNSEEGKYVALYSYEASDEDEVSITEGDIVLNGKEVAEGWMHGTVERTGKTGLIPSNYVKPL